MPPTLLAHPLEPIPPDGFSLTPYAVGVLLVVVAVVAQRRPAADDHRPLDASPLGELPRWARWTQLGGLAVVVVVVVSSRYGAAGDPLRLPEVLLLYVLWPGLLLVSFAGPVWRYVDPWSRLASLRGAPRPQDARDVVAAVAAALLWGALFARFATLGPSRALGTALLVYAAAMAVGVLLVGPNWLGRAEVFGLVFGWVTRCGARVRAWDPPANAGAVLAVVVASALVHRARVSRVYGGGELANRPVRDTVLTLIALAVVLGLVVTALDAWSRRRGAPGTVVAALVPATASIVVAELLRRTMVAVQLLPSRLTDPFDQGWSPLGAFGTSADINPFGSQVQQLLSAAILVLGHGWGAWVTVRRTPSIAQRAPAVLALWVFGSVATLVVLAQPPQPFSYGG